MKFEVAVTVVVALALGFATMAIPVVAGQGNEPVVLASSTTVNGDYRYTLELLDGVDGYYELERNLTNEDMFEVHVRYTTNDPHNRTVTVRSTIANGTTWPDEILLMNGSTGGEEELDVYIEFIGTDTTVLLSCTAVNASNGSETVLTRTNLTLNVYGAPTITPGRDPWDASSIFAVAVLAIAAGAALSGCGFAAERWMRKMR